MGSTQVFARVLALTPLIIEVNVNYLPIFSADPLGVQGDNSPRDNALVIQTQKRQAEGE